MKPFKEDSHCEQCLTSMYIQTLMYMHLSTTQLHIQYTMYVYRTVCVSNSLPLCLSVSLCLPVCQYLTACLSASDCLSVCLSASFLVSVCLSAVCCL